MFNPLACSIPYHTHAHAVALNTRLVHVERVPSDASFFGWASSIRDNFTLMSVQLLCSVLIERVNELVHTKSKNLASHFTCELALGALQ